MADRISSLPNAVLCYILSFLPTKQAVSTSVLSQRWKHLWRSIPALDFDDEFYFLLRYYNKSDRIYFPFVQSVSTFIFSRDSHQPLQRFCLTCRSSLWNSAIINTWITAAAQRRVEHLDLCFYYSIDLLSNMLSCKTLIVLKLTMLKVKALSSADLPSLKILHLDCVQFSERRQLAEFLSGTPNLEDLETKHVSFSSHVIEGKFKRLPKLTRAIIVQNAVPLDVVYNVQFLEIHDMVDGENIKDEIPEFHNLTRIEFGYLNYTRYWIYVLEVLKHCPKLQNLSTRKEWVDNDVVLELELDLGEDGACPPYVPECISWNLKTCCLIGYTGTIGEFEFAKYIMQNAKTLQDMTICTCEDEQEKLEMIKELSLCTRLSSTCKLSFN